MTDSFEDAAGLLRGARIAVLTGAGVSTDSGIPDYRGEGSPKRTPMTFQQFASSARHAQRYWAGSHLGWRRFRSARPNEAHRVLRKPDYRGVEAMLDAVLRHEIGRQLVALTESRPLARSRIDRDLDAYSRIVRFGNSGFMLLLRFLAAER